MPGASLCSWLNPYMPRQMPCNCSYPMRTEDKSSLSGHHLDSHLHFRVMYRYVMVATIITLAPLGRTFPHTVLIGMNNISSYKTPHDPRNSRVCKRHLWESAWMAFKRSAVRSRWSPPKKVRFRRCTRKDTTPVLFAFGEFYCFAVIFELRSSYIAFGSLLANKISLKP